MRRRGIRLLSALLLVGAVSTGAVLLAAPAGPAAAQVPGEPATTSTEGENPAAPEQDIIPQPDSGQAPEDAGDRGGALQLVVLAATVVGVGVVATLAVRESRRNRARRTPAGSSR
ncbi:MAG TPA: hypothetical protein VIL48_04980 [Acidimicrobiales bacterium]